VTPTPYDSELPAWFHDLTTSAGSAAGLDPVLRKAILAATKEVAREQVVADALALERQRGDEAQRVAEESEAERVRDAQRRDAEGASRRRALIAEGNVKAYWAIGLTVASAMVNPFGITSIAAIVNGVGGRAQAKRLAAAGAAPIGRGLATVAIVISIFTCIEGVFITIAIIASCAGAGS
jgi:hypothetical protein